MAKTPTKLEIIPPQPRTMTSVEMLTRAVEGGAPVETLAKLMDLVDRDEARQARQAFDRAMADAKAELPTIYKNRTVDYTGPKGRVYYKHEDLAEITRSIDPILSKHGLNARFNTSQEGDRITVTCRISHVLGHSENNSLSGGPDVGGSKNPLQAIASAVTLLQRYTLKAALGLAASDDDDGRGSGADAAITAEELEKLRAVLANDGADEAAFVDYLEIARLEDLPSTRLDHAYAVLNTRRRQKAAAVPEKDKANV